MRAAAAILAALLLAAPARALQRPSSFDELAARADEARAANRIEEAIGLYRKAVATKPGWAEGWFYLGALLYERDAYAEAATAFNRATALTPRAGMAWAMLGLCEFKLSRFQAALDHIRRGRQLGVGDARLDRVLRYHEGVLLIGKGGFDDARDVLGGLAADGAEDEDLTTVLGLAALRLRFSDLLAGDAARRELVTRAGRAELLSARRQFDEALVEYERLVADAAKTPGVQYAFGRFLVSVSQNERAIEAFRREIENVPGHLLARLGIADLKFGLRDFEGGLPYAEEAVRLAPRSPLAHFLYGVLLLETGRTARAIVELETARRSMSGEAKVYFQLGRAYAAAGRKAEAARARETFTRLSKQ